MENVEKNIPNPLNKHVDFFLRVKGQSMIDAGILEDDLVGVKKSSNAENGQIVVARIEDEVTLKRFKKDGDKVNLIAENKNFKDLLIDESMDLTIEGIAVGIVRENLN